MRVISSDLAAYWDDFLGLEEQAARAYNRFVFADEAEARAFRDLLLSFGTAEFAPPATRLALEENRCVGMISFLPGLELTKRRLAGLRMLARSAPSFLSHSLTAKLQLAAQTIVHPQPDDCYISHVAVAKAARGRGVGSFLMAYILNESLRLGCRRCVLAVDPENTPAVRLYNKFGFEVTDRRCAFNEEQNAKLEHLHMAHAL
jgi:ribosomal protein S18 acetylase RimI-like enzyme